MHRSKSRGSGKQRQTQSSVDRFFQKAFRAFSNCSTLCGHGGENLCAQRTKATQQSSASAKKLPQKPKTVTTEATNMVQPTLGPKPSSEDSAALRSVKQAFSSMFREKAEITGLAVQAQGLALESRAHLYSRWWEARGREHPGGLLASQGAPNSVRDPVWKNIRYRLLTRVSCLHVYMQGCVHLHTPHTQTQNNIGSA